MVRPQRPSRTCAKLHCSKSLSLLLIGCGTQDLQACISVLTMTASVGLLGNVNTLSCYVHSMGQMLAIEHELCNTHGPRRWTGDILWPTGSYSCFRDATANVEHPCEGASQEDSQAQYPSRHMPQRLLPQTRVRSCAISILTHGWRSQSRIVCDTCCYRSPSVSSPSLGLDHSMPTLEDVMSSRYIAEVTRRRSTSGQVTIP